MNLLIALRAARGWTDRDALRRSIVQYAELDDVAFDRQFSRDKATLEELGIAISSTAWDDPFTGDTGYGYRIDEADYALTQLDFTPAEAAVVSVAQSLLSGTALAADARSALNKLRGLGDAFAAPDAAQDPAADAGAQAEAHVPTTIAGTAFAELLRAVSDRRAVVFEYRPPGREPARRTLEPYALLTRGDRSYVVGRDVHRDDLRTFRLSRITGRVSRAPRRSDGDYRVPDDFSASAALPDPRTPEAAGAVAATAHEAVLAVAPGRGVPLREAARDTPPPVPAESPSIPAGWDVVCVGVEDLEAFARRLLDFSPSVVVLGPPALIRAHVEALRRTEASLREAHTDTTTGEASHG